MNSQLLHNAWFWFGCYYFFSAVVSGMPSPLPNDGRKYIWAFNTLHALAGSLGRVVARQLPNGNQPNGDSNAKP